MAAYNLEASYSCPPSRRDGTLVCRGRAREENDAGDRPEYLAVGSVHRHHPNPTVRTRVDLRDAAKPPLSRRRVVLFEDNHVPDAEAALWASPLTPGLERV